MGHVLVKPSPGVVSINPKVLSDDGIWYSAKSLEFVGFERQEAYDQTIEWWNDFRSAETLKYEKWSVPADTYLIDAFFGSRLTYSILSAPFVKLFGFHGLLMVPILAFLLIWLMLVTILIRQSTLAFYVPLILLSGSSLYTKALISTAGTDSLLTLFIFSFFYFSFRFISRPISQLFVLNLIVFLGSFTKQSVSIWLAFSLIFTLVIRNRAVINKILILVSFTTLVLNSLACFLVSEKLWGSISVAKKMNWYPEQLSLSEILIRTFDLWFNEIVTVLTKDFNLLFVLSLSVLYIFRLLWKPGFLLRNFRAMLYSNNAIIFFTIGLFAAVILNVTVIGLPNQGLRLQIPLIPFLIILAAQQLQTLDNYSKTNKT